MSIRVSFARALHRSPVLQLALIFAFWGAGNGLVRLLHLTLPGAVLGLGLLLALLCTRVLSVRSLQRGSRWLLRDMLLFFVPAVLALQAHPELLGFLGIKLLVAILISTAAVMLATALAVDACYLLRQGDAHLPLPSR